VKSYNAYTRQGADPVLVAEGFSLAAFLFGPFWLLAHRAWIAGIILLCAAAVAAALLPEQVRLPAALALGWLAGLFGRELVGWSLERRGFDLAHVVAARDEDAAYARLMAARPDLVTNLPVRAEA
jgi:hypothetical protein